MVSSFRRARAAALPLLSLAFLGCGGNVFLDGAGGSGPSVTTSTSSNASSSSGGPIDPGDWETLIDGTWSLEAGTEGYWCTWKTFPEDVYIKAFRALAPQGTHHTLLLRDGGGQPDGQGKCGPTLGSDMFYASGVGTDDLTFPEGVAVKIPAGTQLQLNLHLFNVSMAPISGVSGTLVKTVPAAEVKQTAEMILAGTFSISIPPNGTKTEEGTCHFPGASTISTVWPHMHQYGTHMKVTYEGFKETKVLHDGPFAFGEQKNYGIAPLLVAPGEGIRIECTYKNPTGQTIGFGDSSEAEMCFAGLYRYPALDHACN